MNSELSYAAILLHDVTHHVACLWCISRVCQSSLKSNLSDLKLLPSSTSFGFCHRVRSSFLCPLSAPWPSLFRWFHHAAVVWMCKACQRSLEWLKYSMNKEVDIIRSCCLGRCYANSECSPLLWVWFLTLCTWTICFYFSDTFKNVILSLAQTYFPLFLVVEMDENNGLLLIELNPPNPWDSDPRSPEELAFGEVQVRKY